MRLPPPDCASPGQRLGMAARAARSDDRRRQRRRAASRRACRCRVGMGRPDRTPHRRQTLPAGHAGEDRRSTLRRKWLSETCRSRASSPEDFCGCRRFSVLGATGSWSEGLLCSGWRGSSRVMQRFQTGRPCRTARAAFGSAGRLSPRAAPPACWPAPGRPPARGSRRGTPGWCSWCRAPARRWRRAAPASRRTMRRAAG